MKYGFSLVELSIVLVILGLLVGGVLTGQSLIRAAELRSVSVEFEKYTAAMHTFRGKYFQLPGDMNNATSFWGDNATSCPNAAIPDGSPGTCNGNGSGSFAGAPANGAPGEMFLFWQHMMLAGLIEGQYTGLSGPSPVGPVVGNHALPGTNVPRSKLGSNIGWCVRTHSWAGNGAYFDTLSGNYLIMGKQDNDEICYNYSGVLKPEELWNIDTKIDDGRPGRGRVWSIGWNECTTASTSAELDADYDLASTAPNCAIQVNGIF